MSRSMESARSRTSSPASTSTTRIDPVERRGDRANRGAPPRARHRLRVHESRRDGHALGPSQRSRELPPLPPGLRSPPSRPARGAAPGRPPDPHLRPRLRPDHALDRPLPGARPARSRTSRAGTPRGEPTRGSSGTSERPSTAGWAARPPPVASPGSRSSSREARRSRARSRAMIRAVELIERKRDGAELDTRRARELVLGYARGEVPDEQMAAFAMAVFFRGLSPAETYALTDAMVQSGAIVDLSSIGRICVDKHSTGGVGDKTSIALGPVVAACGVPFAKMSGRGLGHTGGTLDKLESIPGFTGRAGGRDVRPSGRRRRPGDRRPDAGPRTRRPAALRAARRDRDRRGGLADRGEHHVEEDRGGRRSDPPRREGRRGQRS